MITASLMYIGFGLLAWKSLWNLTIPYRLLRRPYRAATGATDPISFEVGIDIVFLAWTILFVLLTEESYLFCGKPLMIVLCVALPIGSFVLCFAVGFLLGWAKATFGDKTPNP
jgi:hypothetical protein